MEALLDANLWRCLDVRIVLTLKRTSSVLRLSDSMASELTENLGGLSFSVCYSSMSGGQERRRWILNTLPQTLSITIEVWDERDGGKGRKKLPLSSGLSLRPRVAMSALSPLPPVRFGSLWFVLRSQDIQRPAYPLTASPHFPVRGDGRD